MPKIPLKGNLKTPVSPYLFEKLLIYVPCSAPEFF